MLPRIFRNHIIDAAQKQNDFADAFYHGDALRWAAADVPLRVALKAAFFPRTNAAREQFIGSFLFLRHVVISSH
jgi:hypothetical protein